MCYLIKNNTPSIWNCKRLTLDKVLPLLAIKRNKQLLSIFKGWNRKKFKQPEGCGISQVTSRNKICIDENVSCKDYGKCKIQKSNNWKEVRKKEKK